MLVDQSRISLRTMSRWDKNIPLFCESRFASNSFNSFRKLSHLTQSTDLCDSLFGMVQDITFLSTACQQPCFVSCIVPVISQGLHFPPAEEHRGLQKLEITRKLKYSGLHCLNQTLAFSDTLKQSTTISLSKTGMIWTSRVRWDENSPCFCYIPISTDNSVSLI